MKQLLLLVASTLISTVTFAQCDKSFECKSVKAYFVKPNDERVEIEAESSVKFEKGKITLTISIQGNEATFYSKIDETEKCEWKEAFKEGISSFKVTTDKGAVQEKSVIKLIGKEGKLKVYFGSDPDDKGGMELIVKDIREL
ncbi:MULTISPECIES: hypothetical protein [unclassified Paraflavitalea]|uniref:hypothetical protein n=1 Tax=unclassified Paraflavitalea TaxID=2798305 RepID=UPI003D33F522